MSYDFGTLGYPFVENVTRRPLSIMGDGGISLGPIVAGAVVLLIAIVTGLMKFATWKGGVDQQNKEINNTLRDFMAEIRDDIKTILGRLPSPSVTGGSPLRLTKLGEEISRTLEISEWANITAEELRDHIADKSAYEIQEFCFNYVRKFTPDAEQDAKIKDCAFENGIDIQGVLDVLAVELRDRLLGDREPPDTVVRQQG